MSAISSSGVFILFLNIVVAVFAVVGMQFFGGHFHWPDGTSSRVNFDNFYQVHCADQILHRQQKMLASDSLPYCETWHCDKLAQAMNIDSTNACSELSLTTRVDGCSLSCIGSCAGVPGDVPGCQPAELAVRHVGRDARGWSGAV